ncbi:MAG: hypothetical protein ACOH2D_04955 [Gelidibacter sp.]|uniref:hypothetical protein n=1 Tax=Gelidibacter sp. TaxID=2018083 RepID=UPI0032669252
MTSTLQFKYSKKQLLTILLFGILWLLIFGFYFFFRTESYFGYGYLAIGIGFLGSYIYKKTVHYATIKNGILTKHDLLPKRINLDQITDITYYAGKYKLMTKQSEMIINTMVLDKTSIEDLKKIINQINISKS